MAVSGGNKEGTQRNGRVPLHWFFIVTGASSGIAFGILSVAMPVYALQLGASAGEVGLLRAGTGFGMLCAVLPAGMAVDRFGARRIFLIGSVCNAMFLALCTFAPSLAAFGAAMMGEAFARAFVFAALAAAFLNALPLMGFDKTGWNKGAISLGISFFGPSIGGAMMGVLPFAVIFLAAAVVMLTANFPLRLVPELPPIERADAAGFWTRLTAKRASLAGLLAEPGVRGCLAAEMLVTATFSTFATFIVVLAVTELGLTATEAAWIAGVEGAAYIATSFLCGGRLKRLIQPEAGSSPFAARSQAMPQGVLAYPTALAAGSSVIAAALTGLAFAEGFAALLCFGALLGFGIGLITFLITFRASTLPGGKGAISSLFMTATGVGGTAGPAFGGAVAAAFGASAVFLSFLPLFACLAAAIAFPPWPSPVSKLIPTEDK